MLTKAALASRGRGASLASEVFRWIGNAAAAISQRKAAAAVDVPEAPRRGFVSLVGGGPGAADLATLRALDRIRAADAIFYDRLIDPALLGFAQPTARLVYVGKSPGAHAWTQDDINAALVAASNAGDRVVRLKCGDPGIFGRGGEEAAALSEAGIEWEVVPGVTAASAAAASAGRFLTERGETDTLVLTTGRLRDGDGAVDWPAALRPGVTMAIYMGVEAAPRIAEELATEGLADEIDVTVVSNAGGGDARILGTHGAALDKDIAKARISNPAIILLKRGKKAVRHRIGSTGKSVRLGMPV